VTALHIRPEVSKIDLPAMPRCFVMEAVRILKGLAADEPRPGGYDVVELHATHVALDLTGCSSVRFGGEAYEDAFRLVFRREPEGSVDVIAIGVRTGSAVFRTAQARLSPDVPRPRRRRTHSRRDWERR
jgi:hypothetical protein